MPKAYVSFPGAEKILSCEFTFGLGITPSQARIELSPQSSMSFNQGTLTIGMIDEVDFPGCRVLAPSVQRNRGGNIVSFIIEDRRWRWRFGEIYGRYNIPKADGTINTIVSQEKTPQELAAILLDAMGESGYDVSALPSQTWRPEKHWDGQVPADELDELCDLLGCRVCLGLDNNVRIVRLGVGNGIPNLPNRLRQSYGLTSTAVPDSIKVVCGPTVYQSKLLLEPVGLDNDGRTKPINSLNYMPAAGWGLEDPDGFFNVVNKSDRRLALRTVWRWYRIKSQSDGTTIEPKGFPEKLFYIEYLLPIRNVLIQEQLDQQKDPTDLNSLHPLPAFVEGVFLGKDFSFGNTDLYSDIQQSATTDSQGNTVFGSRYIGSFSLDGVRGIVEFSDWVVKLSSDASTFIAPELYLNCSYSPRSAKYKMPLRSYMTLQTGQQNGTGPRVIAAPDIYAKVRVQYGQDGKSITGTTDNIQDQLNQWCNELLGAAVAEYQTPATQDAEFSGIVYWDLDGAVQQIGWSVTHDGATTRMSLNTEYDLAVPDYKKRREQRKIAGLAGRTFQAPIITGAR